MLMVDSVCDYTQWRETVDHSGGLVAERWERFGCRIYHIELFRSDRGPALFLTIVSEMGSSLYDFGAGRNRMYDSDNHAHWGWLDALFGGRRAWKRELADAAKRFIRD